MRVCIQVRGMSRPPRSIKFDNYWLGVSVSTKTTGAGRRRAPSGGLLVVTVIRNRRVRRFRACMVQAKERKNENLGLCVSFIADSKQHDSKQEMDYIIPNLSFCFLHFPKWQ